MPFEKIKWHFSLLHSSHFMISKIFLYLRKRLRYNLLRLFLTI